MGGCATKNRPPARVARTTEELSDRGFKGRRFITEHFELVSTVRDAEFESALPDFLEAVYRQCTHVIPPAGTHPRALSVYLFGSRAEWECFARRQFPTRFDLYSRIRSGGFTEGSTSVSFHTNRAGTLAALAHETWHQYVGANVSSAIPAWLNEGLACTLESVSEKGREYVFSEHENKLRMNGLREAIQTDRLIPLRHLIETDAGEILSHGQNVITQGYYAQTWALVTYLRYGEKGRYVRAFDRMLKDIADGTFRVRLSAAFVIDGGTPDRSPACAVFESYFGVTPDEMAPAFHRFLLKTAGF